MPKLSFEEIQSIIKAGEPNWVTDVKKQTKTLNVHINGMGVADHLEKIEGFEKKEQKKLREKFATSNRFLFANLLRPVDKCFSAKGGTRIISDRENDIKPLFSNVRNGMSVKKWIMKIQANKYYSDPAGIVLFEVGKKGTEDEGTTYPTVKSIFDLRNYQSSGRRPEWILFEPEIRKDETGEPIKGEYYRFIDGAFDYMFKKDGDFITLVEEETFKNPWGYVPGIINSDIPSYTLKYNESPIQDIIEIAEHYLRSTSVKNIYEFLNGYPGFWQYAPKCDSCNGTGEIGAKECSTCNGTGLKTKADVSDAILLTPPKSSDAPTITPNIGGYIQPDLETWREMREELKWLYKLMNFTLWGSMMEMGENQTATEAHLNVQPRNDRLNKFSDAFEDMSQKMINDIVFFSFERKITVSESWGRRFLMEPADIIWKKYKDAKKEGAPKSTLDHMLTQYYQTEFADDVATLGVLLKAMQLEPFVHKTDEEVVKLNIPSEDKLKKIYFNDWWKTLKENDILMRDVKKLSDDLEKFIQNKTYEESKNLPTGGQGSP